jgi:lipoyl(octanoyl) transferase
VISVIQLGTVDYATGLRLQKKLTDLRKENRIGDVLLLLEHTPVITLGRNAKAANVLASSEQLAQRGVEVFECDRGGDVTFHGPGQLVGYPIFDLRAFPSTDGKRQTLGVIEYVRRLEEVIIRSCADFGIRTERICKLTGVWTKEEPIELRSTWTLRLRSGQAHGGACPHTSEPGKIAARPHTGESAKIAALGVHISHSVTSHGFALNVNTDLDYFNLIIPCGIASKPVTSMAKELGKAVDTSEVAQSIVRNFGGVFQSQILWVETLAALLNETVGVPMTLPDNLREIHKHKENFWV